MFITIIYRRLEGQGRLIVFWVLQVLKKCFSCLYDWVKQFFLSCVEPSEKEIVTLNTDYTQYSTCDSDGAKYDMLHNLLTHIIYWGG